MCRWLAYSGDPVLLDELLYKPKYSLIVLSLHSRLGAETTNGDGFGVGWYGAQPTPGVFRGVEPAWNDRNLRELAMHVASPLVLAHIRASSGSAVQQTNCHPFRHGRWLWMHNGLLRDFPAVKRDLALAVDPDLYPLIEGSTDSELLFFLALTFGLEDDPPRAVERAVGLVEATGRRHGVEHPIQMTVATPDGERLWAFRYSSEGRSRSLFHSTDVSTLRHQYPDNPLLHDLSDRTRLVVSEPLGDLKGAWREVPEGTCVVISGGPGRAAAVHAQSGVGAGPTRRHGHPDLTVAPVRGRHRLSEDPCRVDAGGAALDRSLHDPCHLPAVRRQHGRVVLPRPSQARLAAVPAPSPRARPLGAAPGVVVDRRAVHRRIGVLPHRPDPGVPAARRPGRGWRGVLRGVAAVHLGGGPAVAGDDQRQPRPGAGRRTAAEGADPRAAPDRLVERRRPAPGNALLQRDHLRALQTGIESPSYDRLVWRPDALGSVCFLVSGYLAHVEVSGHLLGRPRRTLESAIATVNLLGCLAFGVSAVASYVVPTTGDERNLAAVNTFTALGALCFLIGAVLLLPEGARASATEA